MVYNAKKQNPHEPQLYGFNRYLVLDLNSENFKLNGNDHLVHYICPIAALMLVYYCHKYCDTLKRFALCAIHLNHTLHEANQAIQKCNRLCRGKIPEHRK